MSGVIGHIHDSKYKQQKCDKDNDVVSLLTMTTLIKHDVQSDGVEPREMDTVKPSNHMDAVTKNDSGVQRHVKVIKTATQRRVAPRPLRTRTSWWTCQKADALT